MSLELAAQHLASRGRKGDSMLVHMAPEEVSGLQALAMAAGGTLTLNPDTGLPEANFLKRMLPMIIGAGLAAATGGTSLALTPGLIGLGMGGFETLRTGSLEKGLMAGLGAYGGAGLAGGLAAAAGTAGAGAAGAGAGAGTTAIDATMANALPVSSGAVAPAAGLGGQSFAQASQAANAAAANQAVNTAMTGALPLSSNAGLVAPATPMAITPPPTSFSTMGKGLGALSEQAGRDAFMGTAATKTAGATGVGGLGGLAKYGSAAASPILFQEPEAMPNPYTGSVLDYDYEYDTTNRTNPFRKIPKRAADGGMMNSGPIEAMSDRNQMQTMMANGGQMFAAGGITGSGNLNLNIPLDLGGGQGGYGGAGGSGSPFSGAGAATQSGFSGQNNAAGGGFGFGSSMMSGMGGTAENGFMSPGGLGGNAPGLVGGLGRFGAAMRAAGNLGGSPMGHALQPGTPEHDNYMKNRVAGVGGSFAAGGAIPSRGVSHLGDYSDGGRLLKGPGDGVSDSIPATIANKRPARLADGEFVVPARIVSELGNGSTEAGARKLYAMMDRVQKARGKTTGKNRVAVNSRAEKLLPA
jgi:hypothetical protein